VPSVWIALFPDARSLWDLAPEQAVLRLWAQKSGAKKTRDFAYDTFAYDTNAHSQNPFLFALPTPFLEYRSFLGAFLAI
jgi:hypothetical protein